MTEGFTGTGVALVTPFLSSGAIDFQGIDRLVHHVISGKVDYVVVLGTTGEPATLKKEEKNQVILQVIKSVNNRIPIIVGIGGNDTSAVIENIKNSDLNGISAILSVAPYYNKPTQKGIYAHFSAIAKESPLPLIVYNVPGRTSCNITADTIIKLATDHKNIIGVKEASGDMVQIMKILRDRPDGFKVISGDDALTLPMIHCGAEGVISVIANSHPALFSNMVRTAMKNSVSEANNLHFKLLEFINVLFEEGSPAGIKTALNILGICEKHVRLPLVPASEELSTKMKKLMAELN
jgi:4-hydroxy-tetrahydrodipicolinate synthase